MSKVKHPIISYDIEFLKKLEQDEESCVTVERNVNTINIHPLQASEVNSTLKEFLDQNVSKYSKRLDGILLGCQNVKVLQSIPSLDFEQFCENLQIRADFFIFKPAIDKILTGVVNKKSKDHVGCLVYDAFNVSLPKPEDCDNWIGKKAHIGQEVKFKVTFTNLRAKLPFIRGELISLSNEDIEFNTEEDSLKTKSLNTITKFDDSDEELIKATKKRKRVSNNNDMQEGKKKHKKSKRKSQEIDISGICELDHILEISQIQNESNVEEGLVKKLKKHKKKKNKELNDNDEDMTYSSTKSAEREKSILKKSKKHKKDKKPILEESTEIIQLNTFTSEVESVRKRPKKKSKRKKGEDV